MTFPGSIFALTLCALFCLLPSEAAALRSEYSVSEDVPVGHIIVNLAREFNIDPRSTTQSLQITNPPTSEQGRYFAIHAPTGELRVVATPDRDQLCEKKEECVVELEIAHGDSRNPEVTPLRIRLTDVNDNAPVFPEKSLDLSIREEMDPREQVISLPLAYDADLGSNDVKSYSLDGRPEETLPFGVDMKDKAPQLLLHQKLDRERKSLYKFRVLARDGGRPERTGTLSVTVKVRDMNDHKPEFNRSSYSTIIEENTPQGVIILQLKATDKDEGNNGRVGYRMARARSREELIARQYFDVYSNDGEAKVIIKKTVDIDRRPNLFYRFTIVAFDHGVNPLEAEAEIIIRVRDVNDDKPKIKISYLKPDGIMKSRGLLTENEEKVFVAMITVTDRDSGPGGLVSCKVDNDVFYLQDIQRSASGYKSDVKLKRKKYKLLTRQGVDRELRQQISFTITCHDNAVAQKTTAKLVSTARVDLRIVDKNDEKPEFTEERYSFYLRENLARKNAEVQVGQVKAIDKDEGDNAKVTYQLLNDANGAFRINSKNGFIFARRSFDREQTQQVLLKVKAVDGGSPQQQSATAEVKIIIADVNDNPPVFKSSDYHFTVVENSRALQVGKVVAVDEDKDKNAQVEYRILSTRPGTRKFFSINRHSGIIHLNSRLDRERQEQFVFHVIAVDKPDHGQLRKTGTTTVTVTVLDENDNRPRIFSPNNNEVKVIDDTEPIGRDLFTMRATDPDEGINGTVSYSVVRGAEGFFSVDKTAGIFYVMRKLEGLHNKLFSVVLMARDNGRGVSLNSTVTVRIRVQSSEESQVPLVETEAEDTGDTGRTLIVVAATVLLLLVLAAVALLVMLKMRRSPSFNRRPNEDEKRKWNDGFTEQMTETYMTSRKGPKCRPPKSNAPGEGEDEKTDEYLLESPTLRSKDLEANYNSLNFYKGEASPDKLPAEHTYYEVAKSKDGSIDYASYEKDERLNDCDGASGLTAKKMPFLADIAVSGFTSSEMTLVAAKRRPEKPFTPYIEASFV